jgi:cyclin-dependent kinase regulatory subunit CKS1
MTDPTSIKLIIENNYSKIKYSDKYEDDKFQYRNITLPNEMKKLLSGNTLLTEKGWRELRILGGPGWEHYYIYKAKPEIILMKRPIHIARQFDKPSTLLQDEIKKCEKENKDVTLVPMYLHL